jgi:Cu/Ag efflux pump CusA
VEGQLVQWQSLVALALFALTGAAVLLPPRLNPDAFPDVTNVQVTVNTEELGLVAEEVEWLSISGIGRIRPGTDGLRGIGNIPLG